MKARNIPHLSTREKDVFWNGVMIGILIGIIIFTFISCCFGILNN